MRKAYEESLDIVKSQAVEPKPALGDQLALVRELVQMLKEVNPPAQSNPPVNQMKDLLEMMKLLREEFGMPGPGSGGEGQGWLDRFLNSHVGAALAQPIATMLTAKLAGLSQAPPATPSTPAARNSTVQVESKGQQRGADPGPSDAQLSAVAQQLLPFILKALRDEISGDELAHALDVMNPEAYAQLAQLGEEGLLKVLQTDQAVWQQLAPHEDKIRAFVHEFVAYGEPEAETAAGSSDRAA